MNDFFLALAFGTCVSNIFIHRFAKKWCWTSSIAIGLLAGAIVLVLFGLFIHT